MTVVVRETQVSGAEEFNRKAYLSFVANEEQLQNLGHSAQDFALTNEPITLQFVFKLDETWRLESEQRRVSPWLNRNNWLATNLPNMEIEI